VSFSRGYRISNQFHTSRCGQVENWTHALLNFLFIFSNFFNGGKENVKAQESSSSRSSTVQPRYLIGVQHAPQSIGGLFSVCFLPLSLSLFLAIDFSFNFCIVLFLICWYFDYDDFGFWVYVYCSLYMRGFWWFRVLCSSPSFVVSDLGFLFLSFICSSLFMFL
jgi:hypothetical protein